MLTAPSIQGAIARREIVVDPFAFGQLNANSYDLRLAKNLVCYSDDILDVRKDNPTYTHVIHDDGFVLHPGQLYLGCTLEYTESHAFIPMINGKSSLARLGLAVHVTGGFGDLGFCGHWTLEMAVIRPLRIYTGMRIAQVCWFSPSEKSDFLYCGKYQNSTSENPVSSRMFRDFRSL